MAEDLTAQIDAALAAMDTTGLTDDDDVVEDPLQTDLSPPGSPLTSDKNVADGAESIPISTVSEHSGTLNGSMTTTTQGRGRCRGRGRGSRYVVTGFDTCGYWYYVYHCL